MINARIVDLLLFSAMLVLFTAPPALAQGTYTQIDVSGGFDTSCNGINTAGEVVGGYIDAGGASHGFLLSGVVFTTIDRPGATSTAAFGLNDVGQIVGSNSPGEGAFLYDVATQKFTEIMYPGAKVTFPIAINNAGTIVGTEDATNGIENGFELIGSTYTKLQPPNVFQSTLAGITDSGEVLGAAYGVDGPETNFLFDRGKYKRLTLASVPSAVLYGVNPSGTEFVGFFELQSGAQEGFLYQGGNFQKLRFPGSSHTYPSGINSAGIVVGTFTDSDGNLHGFLWTPPGEGVKK
jgi:probable HAF family extracellular repeat protein